MQTTDIALLALVAIAIVAVVLVTVAMRRRHTHNLQRRFGGEYDRTLRERGQRRRAEAALEEREKRVAELDIRPLTPANRAQFIGEWHDVKADFVDSPAEAAMHADRLLSEIMRARGYPMADFERRYEDLTVDHAEVARHYRAGHAITERQERGEATTEDLRQAMRHYEALFDDLVSETEETAR